MQKATSNQEVLRRNDSEIRQAQQNLNYFQDTLRQLQARKQQAQSSPPASRHNTGNNTPVQYGHGIPAQARSGDRDRALPAPPPSSDYDFDMDPSRSQNPQFQDSIPRPKQYSNLGLSICSSSCRSPPADHLCMCADLIKADTPHTTAKISRMLHQLEFKLQVERKYKEGIDKMVRLYQADGDKKSRMDAEAKRIESEKKIQLLQSALKRYSRLHVLDDAEEDEGTPLSSYDASIWRIQVSWQLTLVGTDVLPGESLERKENLRKPITDDKAREVLFGASQYAKR